MYKSKCLILGLVALAVVTAITLTVVGQLQAAEEKLVPLKTQLPKPLFQGTPKNLKAAPTLEKYDEKPRRTSWCRREPPTWP